MKQDILVSVYMFSYNHQKYIRKAVESVLNQKTNFLYEIIIHDDASTDSTPQILKQLELDYPNRLNVIYQQSNQYGAGVDIFGEYIVPLIKGKYMICCECDDYWCDLDKLQKQVDVLEKNPLFSACTHNCNVVDENDEKKDINSLQLVNCKEHIYKRKYFEFDSYFPGTTAAKLYRTSVYRGFDKDFYNELMSIPTQGDVLNNFILSLSGDIYYFEKKMSAYRRVESSGDSWSAQNRFINKNDRRFIASIRIRSFARKYYGVRYKNYYSTFNAVIHALILLLKYPNEENKNVMKNICNEKGNALFLFAYVILISFVAIPQYFVRTYYRKRVVIKD